MLVKRKVYAMGLAAASVLAACGGGGGSPPFSGSIGNNPSNPTYTAGVYSPSNTYASLCASPRPSTSDKSGSALSEKMFLRSWTHELYLWYSEVPDIDPASYTVLNYFDLLKTNAVTPSGKPRDQFHFTYDTAAWQALSQSGVDVGYGANWVVLAGAPPRKVVVAYTDPGTPAAAANIGRGAEVKTVDGVDVVNGSNVDALNAGLFPANANETHTLGILDLGATIPRTVTLMSANVTTTPVQNVSIIPGTTVGYIQFNDHLATAEAAFINAINQLLAGGATDLMLDMRYNGGGYLDLASEVAYMIAGAARTSGRTFELQQFSDKYPSTNPVTGRPLAPMPFYSTTQGFTTTPGQPLPTLNLSRVFVITGRGTASASESVMNGLNGIGLQVIQIGSTTRGKPYGYYPQDNCGTTYFSIEFKGVNAVGFGDYADGFSPANSAVTTAAVLPGCSVADDFTRALGDPLEGRLAAALNYRATSSCPAATGLNKTALSVGASSEATAGSIVRSPLRENRWYR